MTNYGYADLHCHPMAHRAFGGARDGRSLFWGSPMEPLPNALPGCSAAHAFWRIPGLLSRIVPWFLEHEFVHGGFNSFSNWPQPSTRIHQQMHVLQVQRAFCSGLRLMVASAMNNELLADRYHGPADSNRDDQMIEAQLDGIIEMVDSHKDWMAIVRTPEEAGTAIERNKLAVILGIEVDSIAGPTMRRDGQLNPGAADGIVERWWKKGVRLIDPIHLADNALGGAAIYDDYFNFLNHYLILKYAPQLSEPWFFEVQGASVADGTGDVKFRLSSAWGASLLYRCFRYRPSYGHLRNASGHVNTRGLSDAGQAFLRAMMARGMLIDVEHMSNRSLHETLGIAEKFAYPLFSTHTAIRSLAVGHGNREPYQMGAAHEAMRSDEDLLRIRDLGGVLGIGGHLGLTRNVEVDESTSWTRAYEYAVQKLGFSSVAIGTDMNGFAQAPGPRFEGEPLNPSPRRDGDTIRPIRYGRDKIPLTGRLLEQTGLGRRSYDFNFDGLAHYGLLPDFTVDVAVSLGYQSQLQTEKVMTPFFTSADAVVKAWTKCVEQSRALTDQPVAAGSGF